MTMLVIILVVLTELWDSVWGLTSIHTKQDRCTTVGYGKDKKKHENLSHLSLNHISTNIITRKTPNTTQ